MINEKLTAEELLRPAYTVKFDRSLFMSFDKKIMQALASALKSEFADDDSEFNTFLSSDAAKGRLNDDNEGVPSLAFENDDADTVPKEDKLALFFEVFGKPGDTYDVYSPDANTLFDSTVEKRKELYGIPVKVVYVNDSKIYFNLLEV
jgi:hypothetical protein